MDSHPLIGKTVKVLTRFYRNNRLESVEDGLKVEGTVLAIDTEYDVRVKVHLVLWGYDGAVETVCVSNSRDRIVTVTEVKEATVEKTEDQCDDTAVWLVLNMEAETVRVCATADLARNYVRRRPERDLYTEAWRVHDVPKAGE
jgi:hypothetical protein